MFSGIIETQGRVSSAEKDGTNLRVAVAVPRSWKFKKGDSIALDGICSTIIAWKPGTAVVQYMLETLRATTAHSFAKGRVVNLERSLRLGDFLHGHFVQGHVDAVGAVYAVGNGEVTIRVPKETLRFIARKGSVAVNGVSLTVQRKKGDTFTIALIPFTLSKTNLGKLTKGDKANIETDMLARYLASMREKV